MSPTDPRFHPDTERLMFTPSEVVLDAHGRQVLAVTATGGPFRQYVACSLGCGYLIGSGDAYEDIWHESCHEFRNPPDRYPKVQEALDSFTDQEKHVALVRLAMRINNGDEHFDHGEPGYSWLCHRCALEGRGGLNGWVGALQMLGTLHHSDGSPS